MGKIPLDKRKVVLVTGYPRSGNTWLTRMIAEMLDSPFVGVNESKPVGAEGKNRKGDYFVSQVHLTPVYLGLDSPAIVGWRKLNIDSWNGERIIHIMRDPRDVAVSAYKYWDIKSIRETIAAMRDGAHPLGSGGKWSRHIEEWLKLPVCHTTYEKLSGSNTKTERMLKSLMKQAGLPTDKKDIKQVVENQSFRTKKDDIMRFSEKYSYNRKIQNKHMRKGIVGDYKNHFTQDDGLFFERTFGEELEKYGYEHDRQWYLKLKKGD